MANELSHTLGEPIVRRRGDTAPDVFLCVGEDGNVPADFASRSYVLTVNTHAAPDPSRGIGTELLQVSGTLADIPTGRVEFPPTTDDVDQDPGVYFYDVQQTDAASKKKTVAQNTYTFVQDQTKT